MKVGNEPGFCLFSSIYVYNTYLWTFVVDRSNSKPKESMKDVNQHMVGETGVQLLFSSGISVC